MKRFTVQGEDFEILESRLTLIESKTYNPSLAHERLTDEIKHLTKKQLLSMVVEYESFVRMVKKYGEQTLKCVICGSTESVDMVSKRLDYLGAEFDDDETRDILICKACCTK